MRKLSFLSFLALSMFSCNRVITVDQSELRQVFTDLMIADSVKSKYYLIDSIDTFDTKSINESDSIYQISYCDEVKKRNLD